MTSKRSNRWKKIKGFFATLKWEDIFTFLRNYRIMLEEIGKVIVVLFLLMHLITILIIVTRHGMNDIFKTDELKIMQSGQ